MLETKKYLKLKRLKNGYEYKGSNDAGLETLNYFLDDCHHATSFKEWINDSAIEKFGGNVTTLTKKGDKIIITLEFVDDEKEAFETTIEELIRIMDHWKELCKKMPKEILITQCDNTVILEGKD